jgi:hypothetical protein
MCDPTNKISTSPVPLDSPANITEMFTRQRLPIPEILSH